MKISISKIIWNSLWLLLLFLPLFPSGGKQQYLIIAAWAISISITYLKNNIIFRIDKNEKTIAYAPIAMIAVWVYGLLVGIINNNPTFAITSNFAGTLVYFFFYFLLCFYKNDIDWIIEKIVYASIFVTITILIIFFLINKFSAFQSVWPIRNVDLREMDGKGTHGVFIGGQSLIIALVALSEWNLLSRTKSIINRCILNIIYFVLSSFATVLTNTQGGLKLAYLGTVVLVFMSWIMRNFKQYKKRKVLYLTILILPIIFMGLLVYKNFNIDGIINPQDGGDRLRIEQIRIVLNNFCIFGHGLGNMIYEPLRGSMGYGIEMSYANLFDKYGIFAAIQICIYFITVAEGIIGLVRSGDGAYAIAIGLMGYLFIAAGNPVLFSPTNVVCHCFALFIIYKKNISRRYSIR